MDYSTLQQAKNLEDQIKELRRVRYHLKRFNEIEDDPIKFITNFLNNCQNLSTTSEKKRLAILMIDAIRDEIDKDLEAKELQFDTL